MTRLVSWPEAKFLYHNLTTLHIPGPRSISYFVPFLLLPLALMIPPEKLSHRSLALLFVPVIVACTVDAWRNMGGVDVISTDMLLWCLELIWFRDVRGGFGVVVRRADAKGSNGFPAKGVRRQDAGHRLPAKGVVEDNGEGSANGRVDGSLARAKKIGVLRSDEDRYPRDLLARLHWVGTLIASLRLNDWKIGSRRHDALQDRPKHIPSRTRFCLEQLPILITGVCCLSLTTTLAQHDPFYTHATTVSITAPYPTSSTSQSSLITVLQILPPPLLRSLTIALYAFSLISLQGTLLIPLAVTSNYLFNFPTDVWSPHTLEPYLGSFTAVLDHGVRGFWGRLWHQFRRVVSSGPGVAMGKWLGWRDEKSVSTRAFALQVISSFMLSGITHMGLVPPEPLGLGGWTAWDLRIRVGIFFWVQPAAIAVEMMVARMIGSGPESGSRQIVMRALSLMWVVSWMCVCMPLLAPLFSELGYWTLLPPGFPVHRLIS